MQVRCINSLTDISAADWNRLTDDSNPFLKHEFLAALEQHHCLEENGWQPSHIVVSEQGRLRGAMPLYLKWNSFGEFVFDWTWAEAYQRAGGIYYPKLVAAIPFTPVTGPRLLVAQANEGQTQITGALIDGALNLARQLDVSSLHCLFTTTEDTDQLEQNGLMRRVGYQYHWLNRPYRDFQEFLDSLTSKKRKQIKRERRTVREAGIHIDILTGDQINDQHWDTFYGFYCSTFYRKWNQPRLTLDFFKSMGSKLASNTILLLARQKSRYVAGALCLRGKDTLFGRYWGCSEPFTNLHFEMCYYQAIEYCIANKLKRFEAGAQGEHKLSRGFAPARTWSAHWIRDASFHRAVEDFLLREQQIVDRYIGSLNQHAPFKQVSV
ncbi:MAG: GNAT family N-acetyltransferase [Gammaproteobacteria bacterium]